VDIDSSDSNPYGVAFKIPSLEIAIFSFTVACYIYLIPTLQAIKLQRNEFKIALFGKLADKSSNFMY
jgi:hypothetical protein